MDGNCSTLSIQARTRLCIVSLSLIDDQVLIEQDHNFNISIIVRDDKRRTNKS